MTINGKENNVVRDYRHCFRIPNPARILHKLEGLIEICADI